jgi:hypothetical protein
MDLQEVSAKQSQFPHGRVWDGAGQTARAAGGTHCAKQSQFLQSDTEGKYLVEKGL